MIELEYEPRGAALSLFHHQEPEIVMDGPAGTGKSRAAGEYINWFAEEYAGCRILVVRKTLVSLRQSWQVTFEDKVLWEGHPALDGPSRMHRSSYVYPNGSEIVLGGCDNYTRLFSTEYDLIYVNECTELTLDEWEPLHRALRNGVAPYQQLLGDCNPQSSFHWMYRRFFKLDDEEQPVVVRLMSKHTDNPVLTDTDEGRKYLRTLSVNLSRTQRKRLYEGIWCAAEGQILEAFDESRHVIDAKCEKQDDGFWWISRDLAKPIKVGWFFAGQDWGCTNPGCLAVWAVDYDGRMYLVEEVYRVGKTDNWWAGNAAQLHRKYGLERIVCDDADPAAIMIFNDRLGFPGGRNLPRIAIEADKRSVRSGINEINRRLLNDEIFFFQHSLNHPEDPLLLDRGKPTCTVQEIPGWVWMTNPKPDEKNDTEKPRELDDHGCAQTRYSVLYAWNRDLAPIEIHPRFTPGSLGDVFGHAKVIGA